MALPLAAVILFFGGAEVGIGPTIALLVLALLAVAAMFRPEAAGPGTSEAPPPQTLISACPVCGGPISRKAPRCPKCGHPNGRTVSTERQVLGIVALVFLLLLLFGVIRF